MQFEESHSSLFHLLHNQKVMVILPYKTQKIMIFLSLPPPQYFKAWDKNCFKTYSRKLFHLKQKITFPNFYNWIVYIICNALWSLVPKSTNQLTRAHFIFIIELQPYKVHYKSCSFACNSTLLAHGVDEPKPRDLQKCCNTDFSSCRPGLSSLPNGK